jgi:hypothetical protein
MECWLSTDSLWTIYKREKSLLMPIRDAAPLSSRLGNFSKAAGDGRWLLTFTDSETEDGGNLRANFAVSHKVTTI